VPASCQLVDPGVRSCHTGLGHYYEVYGEAVTHPGSAAAWGQNIRDHVAAERRARVPGWFGSSSCPTSAGSIVTGLIAVAEAGSPTAAAPCRTPRMGTRPAHQRSRLE
jgi:hypothetical protein